MNLAERLDPARTAWPCFAMGWKDGTQHLQRRGATWTWSRGEEQWAEDPLDGFSWNEFGRNGCREQVLVVGGQDDRWMGGEAKRSDELSRNGLTRLEENPLCGKAGAPELDSADSSRSLIN